MCIKLEIEPDNIFTIVTDNAANIVKVVEDFVGKEKHLRCCANKINFVVKSFIKDVQELPELMEKVGSIVTWLKEIIIASDALRAASDFKLKQDVGTRWNSTI